MSKLAEYLNRQLVGDVFDRPTILNTVATDRSILRIAPRVLAMPESTKDVQGVLRFINQLAERDLRLPVTVRGTGLSKTGASIGSGLVLSTVRLNHIEELDTRGRLVRVQPGVTLGDLNQALSLHGLWLPIGCHPQRTIGGLIADLPPSDYAGRYHSIGQYLERVEMVTFDGEEIQLAPMSARAVHAKISSGTTEGKIYQQLERIVNYQADAVLDQSTRPFDAAGYYNIIHAHEGHGLNLLPLLLASQGTLGVITDIILKVVPLPSHHQRLLVSFHDLKTAQRFLNFAYDLEPYLLKIYDLRILEAAALLGKKPSLFTRKFGQGFLVLVGFDQGRLTATRHLKRCLAALPDNVWRAEETKDNHDDFHMLETVLETYLNDSELPERTPICDDVYIPNANFGDFVAGLLELERAFGQILPLFGSFATASYSVRPAFDCSELAGRKQTVDFLRLFTGLVRNCQGSITGNSPEGRVKTLVREAGSTLDEKQLYTAIKEAFDPYNILNPGVKLNTHPRDILRHLRTTEKDAIILP